MNGKFFSKSISLLVVAVLILLAFFREPKHQWMFIAVFGVWAACLLLRLLAGRIAGVGRLLKKAMNGISAMRQKAKAERTAERQKRHYEQITQNPDTHPAGDESADKLLLGHLNCRITEKLKSVFSEATWQWQEKNPERIAKGGTGRIRIEGADEYGYADVTVDKYFRISFEMMKIVSLQDVAAGSETPEADTEETGEFVKVNVADWYEWVGKEALHEVITELNTRGYSKVFVKENGDIYVVEDGNETVKATFKDMPGKTNWAELVEVLKAGQLQGEIDNDRLIVAWA